VANSDRRSRAESRRSRVVLHKTLLHGGDADLASVRGPEAVSLVHRLTRESWSLAGLSVPSYTRSETPIRFVPRPRR